VPRETLRRRGGGARLPERGRIAAGTAVRRGLSHRR
jgi:hypothetical protein